MSTHDPVNHPSHYTSHPSGVECITVVEHMSFNAGNAVKYIWRAGLKDGQIQDLEKARWYINREIDRLRREADRLSRKSRSNVVHVGVAGVEHAPGG